MESKDNMIKVTIDIDPELQAQIEELQEKTGITDNEIFALGVYESIKNTPLEEILKCMTVEQYKNILDTSERVLEKFREYMTQK